MNPAIIVFSMALLQIPLMLICPSYFGKRFIFAMLVVNIFLGVYALVR